VLEHQFLHLTAGNTAFDSGIGATATLSSIHNGSHSLQMPAIRPNLYDRRKLTSDSSLPDRQPFAHFPSGLHRARSCTPLLPAVSPPLAARARSGSVGRLPSAVPSPRLADRLSTLRLRPTRRLQEFGGVAGARGGVDGDGRVRFHFDYRGKNGHIKYVERMTVSGDGDTVRVSRIQPGYEDGDDAHQAETDVQEYKYDLTLPRTYFQKYNVAAAFVVGLRKVTPKVTLYDEGVSCYLMENGPPANFEAKFHDVGARVIYHASKNQVRKVSIFCCPSNHSPS